MSWYKEQRPHNLSASEVNKMMKRGVENTLIFKFQEGPLSILGFHFYIATTVPACFKESSSIVGPSQAHSKTEKRYTFTESDGDINMLDILTQRLFRGRMRAQVF